MDYTKPIDAYKMFGGDWMAVARYVDSANARWQEEHAERLRLEERLKHSEAMKKHTDEWLSEALNSGDGSYKP